MHLIPFTQNIHHSSVILHYLHIYDTAHRTTTHSLLHHFDDALRDGPHSLVTLYTIKHLRYQTMIRFTVVAINQIRIVARASALEV